MNASEKLCALWLVCAGSKPQPVVRAFSPTVDRLTSEYVRTKPAAMRAVRYRSTWLHQRGVQDSGIQAWLELGDALLADRTNAPATAANAPVTIPARPRRNV